MARILAILSLVLCGLCLAAAQPILESSRVLLASEYSVAAALESKCSTSFKQEAGAQCQGRTAFTLYGDPSTGCQKYFWCSPEHGACVMTCELGTFFDQACNCCRDLQGGSNAAALYDPFTCSSKGAQPSSGGRRLLADEQGQGDAPSTGSEDHMDREARAWARLAARRRRRAAIAKQLAAREGGGPGEPTHHAVRRMARRASAGADGPLWNSYGKRYSRGPWAAKEAVKEPAFKPVPEELRAAAAAAPAAQEQQAAALPAAEAVAVMASAAPAAPAVVEEDAVSPAAAAAAAAAPQAPAAAPAAPAAAQGGGGDSHTARKLHAAEAPGTTQHSHGPERHHEPREHRDPQRPRRAGPAGRRADADAMHAQSLESLDAGIGVDSGTRTHRSISGPRRPHPPHNDAKAVAAAPSTPEEQVGSALASALGAKPLAAKAPSTPQEQVSSALASALGAKPARVASSPAPKAPSAAPAAPSAPKGETISAPASMQAAKPAPAAPSAAPAAPSAPKGEITSALASMQAAKPAPAAPKAPSAAPAAPSAPKGEITTALAAALNAKPPAAAAPSSPSDAASAAAPRHAVKESDGGGLRSRHHGSSRLVAGGGTSGHPGGRSD